MRMAHQGKCQPIGEADTSLWHERKSQEKYQELGAPYRKTPSSVLKERRILVWLHYTRVLRSTRCQNCERRAGKISKLKVISRNNQCWKEAYVFRASALQELEK